MPFVASFASFCADDFILLVFQIVHKKTASVLCLTSVKNEDKLEFSKILEAIKVSKVEVCKSARNGIATFQRFLYT